MIKIKSVAGPNPYVAGTGAVVAFGEFETVVQAMAKCSSDQVLAVNDTAYALVTVITGNVVNVLVFAADTVGVGPNAWAELVAGNMAGLTFTVIADGQ